MTKRIAPFVGAALVAWAFVPFLKPSGTADLIISAALIPPIVASAYLVPWRRLPAWTQAIPPIAYFAVVALLLDATGGHHSVLSLLLALPVAWFALYGTRRQLVISVLALVATIALPVLSPVHRNTRLPSF